jgi:dihydroorotate dehydrogenase
MTPAIVSALMPVLRLLDPETSHRLALRALRLGLAGRAPPADPMLSTEVLGLRFPTPIGLAAGFDKDAVAVAALRRLGFGFVEVGTVTVRPQPGNPRPRLFRLAPDRAVINRMGFNGAGMASMAARLTLLPPCTRPIGVNLGLNKDGAVPAADYAVLAARLGALADYLVVNVSSPNTPGLRDLQAEAALGAILASLPRPGPPVLVKLSPDLAPDALPEIVKACIEGGAAGLIVSNTSTQRPSGLRGLAAAEAGGLSGRPLFARATALLARAYREAAGRLVLVGVGGVETGAQVLEKIKAGASLVQVYTAFAYEGPALAWRLNLELAECLRREGFPGPAAAIGTGVDQWLAG